MVKSCREIAEEIDELRRKNQQNRLINMSLVIISETKMCRVDNPKQKCSQCNCWKAVYNDKDALEN